MLKRLKWKSGSVNDWEGDGGGKCMKERREGEGLAEWEGWGGGAKVNNLANFISFQYRLGIY